MSSHIETSRSSLTLNVPSRKQNIDTVIRQNETEMLLKQDNLNVGASRLEKNIRKTKNVFPKSVIDLAKTETVSFQGSSFVQSVKETEIDFVKLGLTGKTISGPSFTG